MIHLPGSKSISIRALLFASFQNKTLRIKNLLECDDTKNLINALKAVGVKINKKNDEFFVSGGKWHSPKKVIDFGDNATGLRLFLAAASAMKISAKITGSKRLLERPHSQLIKALNKAGVNINDSFTITKNNKKLGPIEIQDPNSSQFISAAIIFHHLTKQKLFCIQKTISQPYAELTKNMLNEFKKQPSIYKIEPDASSLAPFIAFAMISGKTIEIADLSLSSKQADMQVIKECKKIGAKTMQKKDKLIFIPPPKLNKSFNNINGENFPDGVLSLMMIAPFLPSKTEFTGIHHLKFKESDRLALVAKNLKKMGVKVEINKSELTIFPSKPKKTKVDPENDHRIAMNFAILGAKINNPNTVSKSFPNFFQTLANLQSIILIGSRGTGKTTLGKLLAKKTNLPFKDLDEILEKKHKAISLIQKEKITWEEFRKLESKALFEILNSKTPFVLATGGGTAEKSKNRNEIQKIGTVIYLHGNEKEISKGLAKRKNTPKYKNSAAQDLKKRHLLYSPIANLEISVTPWDAKTSLKQILTSLRHDINR
ncbi:hypothetical protein KKC94_01440 [Patescibacteria group bacterium]|nr:hypothetical protein [Patescibacteria group bacterium]